MDSILAHDLGTSGNKASLYDRTGTLVALSTHSYPTSTPRPGFVEQDPELWWAAVVGSTRRLLETSGLPPSSIACVTFSGQMMGCVPVDRKGEALRPALIWADMRSEQQADTLAKTMPLERFYRLTGHRPSSSYTLTKLMWLRDHEPTLFKKTAKTLQAKDYIIARLTGVFATDYSDASGTNAFDLVRKQWSREILGGVGIDLELFPDAYPSSSVVGTVTRRAAAATGLLEGTPVVIGGGDGCCAATGAGVVKQGTAYNVLGSSSWIALATSEPVLDPAMRTFNWIHLDEKKYSPCGTMQAAGLSVEWLRKCFGDESIENLESVVLESPAGARNLLFLPYLLGERSPRWDASARGAYVGLTANHTKADLHRALFEGIAFNLKTILLALEGGADVDEIVLIGGGAKNRLWRQILADIWEKPVLVPQYLDEATSLGAAIAGGVGVGLFPDYTVAEVFNPVQERILPLRENTQKYRQLYPLFEEAYFGLKDTFAKLGQIQQEASNDR